MARFLRDPWPWVEPTVLGEGGPPDDAGIFHVTTRVDAVRASGGLKARRDLGGIVALGGGSDSAGGGHAPGLVSFVYDRSRALWLYGVIRTTALAARNEIGAADLLNQILDWTGFPGDIWGDRMDAVMEEFGEESGGDGLGYIYDDIHDMAGIAGIELAGDITTERAWREAVRRAGASLDETFSSGAKKYQLIQDFEARLMSTFLDRGPEVQISCVPTVGFTASWAKFSQIAPDQISILQCEVREGARVDFEPAECELRFAPEDVRVVRYGVEKDGALPIDREAAE